MLESILSPVDVGPLRLKNRVVLTPHVSYLGRDHLPTTRLADYLEERAAGGVGLVVVEASSTHPSNIPYEGVLLAYDPRSIEGYRQIVERVRPHGAKILLELAHKGTGQTSALSERPLLAASAVVDIVGQEVPKAMDVRDIEEMRESFLLCGRHAIEAGFDGIEVHATHGYLLQQFLSPLTNRRTDEYGGSLENRMRLLTDILRGLRELLGSDRALGVRLAGHELTPGGLDEHAFADVAVELVRAGLVDHLSITGANNNSYHKIIAPMEEQRELFVPYAAEIKRRIEGAVPVIVTGKILTLAQGDALIASGQVDMVGMLRAHVADPHLIRKTVAAANGEPAEPVRPCVGANACINRVADRRGIRCVQNPTIGREREVAEREEAIRAAGGAPRVTVVGGGPAGVKAAETAARLGASVTLFERADALGGQLRLVGVGSDRRASLRLLADHLARRLDELGVEVRSGEEWDAAAGGTDGIVVATGSLPDRTGFIPLVPAQASLPGIDAACVTFPDELLVGERAARGGRALVVEDEIGWRGFEVASYLAQLGHDVTLATSHPRFGLRMAFFQELPYLQDALVEAKVNVASSRLVTAIGDDGRVTALDLDNRAPVDLGVFDVVCVSRYRQAQLPGGLDDAGAPLRLVGDAAAPRTLLDAVREGYWETVGLLEELVGAHSSRDAHLV